MKYYKLYFQKSRTGSPVVESIAAWGMYCMSIPFGPMPSSKELNKNEWADEDGDDEYIPEQLAINGYSMTVKLGFKGDKNSANASLRKMLGYLTGADCSGVEMKYYCDYTKEGRSGVRFVKINDEAELVRDDDGDILVVSVELKVNAPMSDITYTTDSDGNIVSLVNS